MFQPAEIENKHITHLERKKPLDHKLDKITFQLPYAIPNFTYSDRVDKDLYTENDNTDINNKKSIIHFKFPGDDFWEVLNGKEKRKPIKCVFDALFTFDINIKFVQNLISNFS